MTTRRAATCIALQPSQFPQPPATYLTKNQVFRSSPSCFTQLGLNTAAQHVSGLTQRTLPARVKGRSKLKAPCLLPVLCCHRRDLLTIRSSASAV
jgi:hypothetical protein